MRLVPRPRRAGSSAPAADASRLTTTQEVDGSEHDVEELVLILTRAGYVVESVTRLGPGKWAVTARSED